MFKKISFIIVGLLFIARTVSSQNIRFAIIVDQNSYTKAKVEIEQYKSVLDSEGLQSMIQVDKWHNPDSIRNFLKKKYNEEKLFEGAVFIGNIPIPMLRNAQHLTTAFKMDQDKNAWNKSSVPSDRFYEDFDLKFNFLKHDSLTPAFFYYSLSYDSPQKLSPKIYTGRIKIYNDNECFRLKSYLKKVIAAHKDYNTLNQVLLFAGHGYNSESWTARMDEKTALLQQFPQLNAQKVSLQYIDHSFETHIKYDLLTQLSRNDLDLALLHHHGGITAQYLNGTPKVDGVSQSIDNLKYYIRSKMQDAAKRKKNLEETINSYRSTYGFPSEWFENFNEPQQVKEDSIFWNNMDISSEELDNYNSNARFIMFDACFNGSFYKNNYLASKYVFGNGNTIAAQGNTVNVYQDKFPDRYIGLLSIGMRVGEWNRYVCTLETHIIGDPTYRFTPIDSQNDFDRINPLRSNNKKLIDLLKSNLPDVRSWALRNLYINKYSNISELLRKTYFSSTYYTERLECLELLSEIRDNNFIEVLQNALSDSYELVCRLAAIYSWKTGNPQLIPQMVETMANPNCSKRVSYQLREGIPFFDKNLLKAYLSKIDLSNDFNNYKRNIIEEISVKVDSSWSSYENYMADITSPKSSEKNRNFAIRALRNKMFHQGIKPLTEYFITCNNEQIQLNLLETFGWFKYSYNKYIINELCDTIIKSNAYSNKLKEEAKKTINRLQ